MHDQRLTTRLINYWESIKKERDIPPMELFNPQAIDDLWQRCFVISVRTDHSKITYTYSYVGDDIKTIFGSNMVGQKVNSKMVFTPARKMIEKMDEAVTMPDPKLLDGKFVDENSNMIKYRSCLLPMGHDKQNITDIIVGISWTSF